jgi:DNA polymerase-3 subunit beta
MKYTISKNNLMDIIQKTVPVIPSRTSLQVLYNFKMIFSSDKLEIIASDLDNFVKATTEISGDGDAEIAVNAKKLFEIVREIGNEQLSIEIVDNSLIIISESGFSCKITGVDLREFPHFPDSGYSESYSIKSDVFKKIVEKSSFAVSRDEARACLCGVLWECSAHRVGMVATDGHRLGASFANIDLNISEDISVVVPNKSLQHILKTVEIGDVEDINFSFSEKHIVFTVENFTLSTKLIDGPYPDYEKGIPKEFSKTVIIDRENLISAIKSVSVLSNKKTRLIKIDFDNSSINISANNREIGGEANQVIPAEYSGEEDHMIGFNGTYILEILSIIKTEKIRIEMNSQVSATVLFPVFEDDNDNIENDIFLIMPLRIFE